ncbi:MAG TPA: hypothetical protein HA349_05015 [Methanotrichaceae archaeon]|nr:hypothetical protein [Methanotrichaceae archaeon]
MRAIFKLLGVVGTIEERDSEGRWVVQAKEILRMIERGEDVEIENRVIKGELNLSGREFRKTVKVNNCIFQNIVRFSDTTFHDDAYFARTQFNKKVFFINVTFCKGAYFGVYPPGSAQFKEQVYFGGAHFKGNAYFSGTKFNKFVDFSGVVKDVYMEKRETLFEKDAIFGRVNFNGTASFSNVKFYRKTSFNSVQFGKTIWFRGARFEGETDFELARFDDRADFSCANFLKDTNFKNVIFGFEGDKTQLVQTLFESVRFKGDVNFKRAEFYKSVSFSQTEFLEYDEHSSTSADFDHVKFHEDADFKDAKFKGDVYFYSTEFKKKLFLKGANFNRIRIPSWNSIKDKIDCDGPAYLLLVSSFKKLEQFDNADDCYYDYREWRRKSDDPSKEKRSNCSKFYDFLSHYSSGYGVRLRFPLGWIFGLVFTFGLLYLNINQINITRNLILATVKISTLTTIFVLGKVTKFHYFDTYLISVLDQMYDTLIQNIYYFGDRMYLSAMIFTGQTPINFQPIGAWKLVVMFESVLGYLLLALFIVVLARKLIRWGAEVRHLAERHRRYLGTALPGRCSYVEEGAEGFVVIKPRGGSSKLREGTGRRRRVTFSKSSSRKGDDLRPRKKSPRFV